MEMLKKEIAGFFPHSPSSNTHRYMARELLNWGGVADLTKCDIFSLGISGM